MGLDIKANTMDLLVSLELEWYDDRLSWDPFLGGCQRASFRASFDSDETEIWVPHLELVNMADSGNALPEASASVMYDGRVMWRRTGVLSVTCRLTGIESFPFDTAGYVGSYNKSRPSIRVMSTHTSQQHNSILLYFEKKTAVFSSLVVLAIHYSTASSTFPAASSIRQG
jgi:Neurotransmitter-gated ion-channel ligand binding domain